MEKVFNKKVYLYIIFGIITTIINICTFSLLNIIIDYKISNIIALILTKLSAYILNKKYVFKSKCENFNELMKEFTAFVLFRGITLLIDYFGLILLVELVHIDKLIGKIIVTIIVIIINYICSDKYVFKKQLKY